MAEAARARWPVDLKVFGGLAGIWSASLVLRVFGQKGLGLPGDSIQAVIGGLKFYGGEARFVLLAQAIIYAVIASGILGERRWALVVALLYMLQVVIGHLLFILSYAEVPGQQIHVKIAAVEGPLMVLILLYLWIRSKELLFGGGAS